MARALQTDAVVVALIPAVLFVPVEACIVF